MSLKNKYKLDKVAIVDAIAILRAVLKVELAVALSNQHRIHSMGDFTDSKETDLKRMDALFQTAKVITNCTVIEMFLDHIKKEIY